MELRGMVALLLVCVLVAAACGDDDEAATTRATTATTAVTTSATTVPATAIHDGVVVFVVELASGDCPANASCWPAIRIGGATYQDPTFNPRAIRDDRVSPGVFAVGRAETSNFVEVRQIVDVPPDYLLAARLTGSDGWLAVGGMPVEGTELEDEAELAAIICASLLDVSTGWSFCQ